MYSTSNFDIQIQSPVKEDWYDPPSDPLNEYTDFEIGLKKFCFEHNRYVLLEIGNQQVKLHLYHDILDALENNWGKRLFQLAAGKEIWIAFNYLILKLLPNPSKNEVTCQVNFLGESTSESYTILLDKFIEKMSNLIDEILKTAIQEDYINTEDIEKYLGWKLNYNALMGAK